VVLDHGHQAQAARRLHRRALVEALPHRA
jgi:hypothetical protein